MLSYDDDDEHTFGTTIISGFGTEATLKVEEQTYNHKNTNSLMFKDLPLPTHHIYPQIHNIFCFLSSKGNKKHSR